VLTGLLVVLLVVVVVVLLVVVLLVVVVVVVLRVLVGLGLNIREGLRVVMAGGLFVVGLAVGLGLNTGGGTGLEVGPEDEPPLLQSPGNSLEHCVPLGQEEQAGPCLYICPLMKLPLGP